jgi:hypothetical protein
MTKLSLTFEAEDELLQLVLNYLIKQKKLSSWVGELSPPLDPQSVADDKSQMSDEEWDNKHPGPTFPDGNGADPEPAVAEPPAKRARAPRAPRVSAAPPKPEAEPEPTPAPPPPPPVDLPPLDTLKSVVTAAVRLAQKGEGSKKILDLLPAFKDTTGLAFVMNATDEHRPALYDLVQAAGLPVV